jgi:Domain of unknown function (DUF4340)
MKRVRLILLLLLLAAALAWLGWSFARKDDRLFSFSPENVSQLVLANDEQILTIEKSVEGWTIRELGNVPAHSSLVEALLRQLAASRRGLAKSDDPARFAALGLGAGAMRVSVKDRSGQMLASLHLGIAAAAHPGQRFARLESGGDSFLLPGFATLQVDGLQWSRLSPPRLTIGRLASLTLVEASLKRTGLAKTAGGPWRRSDGKATNEDMAQRLAEAVAAPPVRSLVSAERINWFNAQTLLAETTDGLMLAHQARRDQGRVWLRVSAFARGDATDAVKAEAKALNALRMGAFEVPGDHGTALLATDAELLLRR